MSAQPATAAYTGKTAWARNLASPVRDFLSAESGGAVALLTAVAAALIWANSPWSDSYESFWTTKLSITIGERRDLDGPPRLGQQRSDDLLLPGCRARGQARARHWGAPRAPAPGDPGLRLPGRDGGTDPDLHGLQRRGLGRARLGRGDVHRHGPGARGPGAPGAAGDPASAPPPHDRSGRRPGGAGHHRDRLHGSRRPAAPGAGGGLLRRPPGPSLCARHLAERGGHRRRSRALGGALRSRGSIRWSPASRWVS